MKKPKEPGIPSTQERTLNSLTKELMGGRGKASYDLSIRKDYGNAGCVMVHEKACNDILACVYYTFSASNVTFRVFSKVEAEGSTYRVRYEINLGEVISNVVAEAFSQASRTREALRIERKKRINEVKGHEAIAGS